MLRRPGHILHAQALGFLGESQAAGGVIKIHADPIAAAHLIRGDEVRHRGVQ